MVTAFAPPVAPGEHPDGSGWRRFQATRRSVEHLHAPTETESLISLQETPSLALAAARIEGAAGDTIVVDEAGLPPHLRSHLSLALLRRRAERQGKRLVLRAASCQLRRLAAAAGVETVEPGHDPPAIGHQHDHRDQHDSAPATSSDQPSERPTSRPGPWSAAWASAWAPAAREPVLAATRSPLLHQTPVRVPRAESRAPGLGSRVRRLAGGARPQQAVRFIPRWPGGAALACFVVLVLARVILPSAAVELTTAPEPWSVELPVVVDAQIKQPDLARGRLPGRTVSKEVVETASIPTTGRRTVPDAPATGQVVFINKSDKPVAVPKGTTILAGTTKFATQEDVTVVATTFAGPQQRFGMARVSVVAGAGGPGGNVDRSPINKIEGQLGTMLDAQNDAPLRGGSERVIPYVTAEDRRNLQESLQRTLTERLLPQVRSQLPSNDRETVVPWAGQNPAVVESTYSKNADEEGPSLSLTLKLRFGATVFNNDAYNTMVKQLAGIRLSQTKGEYRLVSETVQPEPPGVVGVDERGVHLAARANGTIVPRIDAGRLRAALANRTGPEAHAYLRTLPGVKSYALHTWPGWLDRLPWLGWRIGVGVATG